MVLNPSANKHGLEYKGFVGAEQEFNTYTYGIKGNIDATILVQNREKKVKYTALEIKTGKSKPNAYRGQVLIYSLLISERFLEANPDNILLYIMDNDLSQGFEYLK